MKEFIPSKNILEKICEDNNPIIRYIRFPPNQNEEKLEKGLRNFICGLVNEVADHYGWNLSKDMNSQKIIAVSESLSNGIAHGTKNKRPLDLGLFFGEKGVCYGFRDGGDYFKSEEIKRIYESKTGITEFKKGLEDLSGRGIGVHIIYSHVDSIEVDTTEGVLYLVQYKESLSKE